MKLYNFASILNEADRLAALLVHPLLLVRCSAQVIFVNRGSRDGSTDIVESAGFSG